MTAIDMVIKRWEWLMKPHAERIALVSEKLEAHAESVAGSRASGDQRAPVVCVERCSYWPPTHLCVTIVFAGGTAGYSYIDAHSMHLAAVIVARGHGYTDASVVVTS